MTYSWTTDNTAIKCIFKLFLLQNLDDDDDDDDDDDELLLWYG